MMHGMPMCVQRTNGVQPSHSVFSLEGAAAWCWRSPERIGYEWCVGSVGGFNQSIAVRIDVPVPALSVTRREIGRARRRMNDPGERSKAVRLRKLIQDVLLPAYNDYDRDASEQLQQEMRDEELRQGLPRKDAMGGARTETVARGMMRKADQHRRVLRALLSAFEMDVDLLDRVPASGDNWLESVCERLSRVVPAAAWRLYVDVEPTEQEGSMLRCLVGDAPSPDAEPPRVWQRHRERGMLPKTAAYLARLVIT